MDTRLARTRARALPLTCASPRTAKNNYAFRYHPPSHTTDLRGSLHCNRCDGHVRHLVAVRGRRLLVVQVPHVDDAVHAAHEENASARGAPAACAG